MDADALREEIHWDSRGLLDFQGKACPSSQWIPPPPHTSPSPFLRHGCPCHWRWSQWLCGQGGRTALTLNLLSPAGAVLPLLKLLVSLTIGLCKYSWYLFSLSLFLVLESLLHVLYDSLLALPCCSGSWSDALPWHSFSPESWAPAKVVPILPLLVAAPNWETCLGSNSPKRRKAMDFVHWFCILPLYYIS